MSALGHGVQEAFWMFYQTFWALVLGFTLSGWIQAFVPKSAMAKTLGDHRAATAGKSMFFGAISSSCSYAASALAHSLYRKGADFTSSIIFMFASTNLVADLAIVMWRLLGWQFAVAEIVGGVFMSILLWLLLPVIFPDQKIVHLPLLGQQEEPRSSQAKISDAAGFTIGDFRMMRVELAIGFIVAGILSTTVPTSFWNHLFVHGDSWWSQVEGAVIGPLIACITFVCSVGNVPMAAALWHDGISFGGTISFIYADLLSIPLLLIYRKYYGKKITRKLFFVFWATMSAAGFVVGEIFSTFKANPMGRMLMSGDQHFSWNSTTYLNLFAIVVAATLYTLYRKNLGKSEEFAVDPICGMQVRIADAPQMARINGANYYFCMEKCKEEFIARAQ